jgi:hypothetical protein
VFFIDKPQPKAELTASSLVAPIVQVRLRLVNLLALFSAGRVYEYFCFCRYIVVQHSKITSSLVCYCCLLCPARSRPRCCLTRRASSRRRRLRGEHALEVSQPAAPCNIICMSHRLHPKHEC